MAVTTKKETKVNFVEHKVLLSQQDLIEFALSQLDVELEDGDKVDVQCKGFTLKYHHNAGRLFDPIIDRKRKAALGAIIKVEQH